MVMKQKISVQIITSCPECGKRVLWKGFADERPACPLCGSTLAELPAYHKPVDEQDPVLYHLGTKLPSGSAGALQTEPSGDASLIRRKNPLIPVIIVGLSFLVAGMVSFFVFFKPQQETKRILREGLPAEGVILSVEQTGNWFNNQPQVRIELEVYAQDKPPFRSQAVMVVPLPILVQLQPGTRWRVRYDPEHPEKAALE